MDPRYHPFVVGYRQAHQALDPVLDARAMTLWLRKTRKPGLPRRIRIFAPPPNYRHRGHHLDFRIVIELDRRLSRQARG